MGGESGDIAARQPSSCFYAFNMASPSWFPLHRVDHHSRFHLLGHDEESPASDGGGGRSRRWRSLLRRLRKEGKGGYNHRSTSTKPPQLTFQYDIVSYSKNFDDGTACCWEIRERGFCRRRCEDPAVPHVKPAAVSTTGPLK